MIREFNGDKFFHTQLAEVDVTVLYSYSDTWDELIIESILSDENTELISILDILRDDQVTRLVEEMYEFNNENN